MIAWLLGNALVASVAAVLVALVCRWKRDRPELCHGLWLLVFALLVMPPLPFTGHPGAALRAGVESLAPGLTTPAPSPSSALSASAAPRLALRPVPLSMRSEAAPVSPAPRSVVLPTTLQALPPLPPAAPAKAAADWPAWTRDPLLLGGGAIALLALIAGYLFAGRIARFHRAVKAAPLAADCDPALQAAVQRVADRLGVRPPEVRVVAGIGSPAVWCLGRARMLWPASDRRGKGAGRRSLANRPSVIAHELAHIARRDTWVARLEPLAVLALFWHPLFWLVRHRVHHYSELACDAWALWAYPTERRAYAEALVDSHAQNRTAPIAVRGLCATHPNVKDLERRLTLIMKKRVHRGKSRTLLAAASALALTVAPGLSQDHVHEDAHAKHTKAKAIHEKEHEVIHETAHEVIHETVHEGEHEVIHETAVWLDAKDGKVIRVVDKDGQVRILDEHGNELEAETFTLADGDGETWIEADGNVVVTGEGFFVGSDGTAAVATSGDGGYGFFVGGDGHDDKQAAAKAAKIQLEIAKLMERADAARMQGQGDQALADYQRVIELDPQHGAAHALSAYLLIGQGQYDTARKHLKSQLAAGHRPDYAYYNFACCDSLEGNLEGAAKNLGGALRNGFREPDLMKGDGDLEALRGTKAFEAAVKLAALLEESIAAADRTQGAERLAQLERVVQIASEVGEFHADLAMAQHMAGDYKRSYATWKRQAELGHEVGMAHYNMGCALALMGKREAAMEKLFQAAELGFSYPPAKQDSDLDSLKDHPDYQRALDALAVRADFVTELEELLASGELDRAQGEVEWLLAQEDIDSEARGWANMVRGDIARMQGAENEARAAYERALGEDYAQDRVAQELAAVYAELGQHEEAAVYAELAARHAKEFAYREKAAQAEWSELADVTGESVVELDDVTGSYLLEDVTADFRFELDDVTRELEDVTGSYLLEDVTNDYLLEDVTGDYLLELEDVTGNLEVELQALAQELELELAQLQLSEIEVQLSELHMPELELQLQAVLSELERVDTGKVKLESVRALEQQELAAAKRQAETAAALAELETELVRAEKELLELERRQLELEQERAQLAAEAAALAKKRTAEKSPQ